ncbi:hypothetical protein OIU77_012870 [Salix suchowensis]|uniref:Glycosyltransferase N-terminal domain-containing protein n=1 Tax=Salix suchowensis TaxID=1278906 RepID=A0ABQ9A575_9ROSI|nr:hypothetical protein OIU77_012870 [Salix suchowensis]
MDTATNSSIRVLMFPWLAYSHIHPFLELAKKLSKRNFCIYLCSTPANLACIKEKEPSVEFVELHLPSLPELPPHSHTTKGLPRHLLSSLMKALDMSRRSFSEILAALKPDLLVSDVLQPWAPAMALSLNIPTVLFMVSAAMPYCVLLDLVKISGSTALPLRSNHVHGYNYENDDLTLQDRLLQSLEGSCNLVLIRSLRELEGKYVGELSVQAMKKIVLRVLLVEGRRRRASTRDCSSAIEQDGKLGREEVAKVVREVVVEETGEQVRRKARELRERIKGKDDEEMDEVVRELVKLCGWEANKPL